MITRSWKNPSAKNGRDAGAHEEPFVLDGSDYEAPDGDESEDEPLEFIVTGPAIGWTDEDTRILESALDLAGLVDGVDRLKASMAVDLLDIVNLTPLVKTIQGLQEQLRKHFDKIRGGIGK